SLHRTNKRVEPLRVVPTTTRAGEAAEPLDHAESAPPEPALCPRAVELRRKGLSVVGSARSRVGAAENPGGSDWREACVAARSRPRTAPGKAARQERRARGASSAQADVSVL